MDPYVPSLRPAMYPQLALVLLAIGIYFAGQFFVYEVTKKAPQRAISQELVLAVSSSVTLGFGLFFLALTVGIPI